MEERLVSHQREFRLKVSVIGVVRGVRSVRREVGAARKLVRAVKKREKKKAAAETREC